MRYDMRDDGGTIGPFSWRSAYALPATLPSIVGRDALLEQALAYLKGGTRLLTLTGSGGVGKTRLAIEIAHCFAGEERSAALLRLAPLRDGAVLPGLIASVCAIDGWPDLPIARLPEQLDSVLVFDGFDHVKDAGSTLLALLERCPNLVAVVTCREALQLPGELALPVEPLSTQPVDGRPADATTLLKQRIGDAGRDLHSVADLAERTGGNALALELIGAHLCCGVIEPFRDRRAERWPLPELIAWAIEALPPEQRTLLRRLSVMAAGFSADAAVSLAKAAPSIDGPTMSQLDQLVRLGFVSAHATAQSDQRFEMPAAIREEAIARLNESGELAAARLAYARHMLERASALREHIFGRQRDAALVWFEVEQAGLRLAFGAFVQLRRSYLARKLALALWPWWILRRNYRVGRRWLKLALELYDPIEPDELQHELLVASGLLELYAGKRAAARARSAEGARPGLAGAQDEWRGASLATLGLLAALEGDYDRAIGLYPIFLDSTEGRKGFSTWLPQLRTVIRLALSSAHLARGELEDANYQANLALGDALRLGDPLLVGYARINLAAIATEERRWDHALEMYRDSIFLLLDRPHAGAVATGLLGLATLAIQIEAYAVAARLIDLAQSLLDAGTPPPPQLIRFDLDAMLAALQRLPPKRQPTARPLDPLDRMADVESIVERTLAELTDLVSPAPAPTRKTGPAGLTSRELEVLCLMTKDMTAREIADALFVGERTVESHMKSIYGKLDVKTRVGAVARALREGWCS